MPDPVRTIIQGSFYTIPILNGEMDDVTNQINSAKNEITSLNNHMRDTVNNLNTKLILDIDFTSGTEFKVNRKKSQSAFSRATYTNLEIEGKIEVLSDQKSMVTFQIHLNKTHYLGDSIKKLNDSPYILMKNYSFLNRKATDQ